jgi:beta-glucanase (GH16 family)
LIWSDEFEYEGAPEPLKWGYDIGGNGWGNNELQNYTNSRENSYIEDGKLFIHAKKVNGNWTSARLITKGKGDFLYGRIEISAKLPTGKGTWPAIWTLPTNWEYGGWPNSGEIDIMEHVGYDQNNIHGTVHTGAYNHSKGTQKGASKYISTASSEFHTYAVEWYEEEILFFIDDDHYFTFENEHKTTQEWPFDKAQHLLLNIAIGGNWGGAQGIDPNLEEAIMEIEYVRVYNNAPAKPIIEGPNLITSNSEASFSIAIPEDYYYNWIVPADATIIDGQGTSTVSIQFGDENGSVTVEMQSDCDTISSDPFEVIVTSNENTFTLPNFDADGNLLWEVEESTNNVVSIEKSSSNEVKVIFDVQSPANNPSIIYHFDSPFNFSAFKRMVFIMKANQSKTPSNMRIDLLDKSNAIDFENLFTINQFNTNDEFNSYAHNFNPDADNCDLENIKSIRLYFNFSGYGEKGSGEFTFAPIEMKNYKTDINSNSIPKTELWPNPTTDKVHVNNSNYSLLELYNANGRKVLSSPIEPQKTATFSLNNLDNGLYLLLLKKGNEKKVLKFIKK